MESNVSKKTFSHKFFKIRFTQDNSTISIQDLLKQKLLWAIEQYQQKANLDFNPQLAATSLERKIILLESSIEPLSSLLKTSKFLLTLRLTPIVYGCSVALALTPNLTIAPQIIAKNLVDWYLFERDNTTIESGLDFAIEIVESGWINFYLSSQSLAEWLHKLLIFIQTTNIVHYPLSHVARQSNNSDNLFSIQYIYSRCCALLRLADREKLIVLKDDRFNNLAWQLSQPIFISWLDDRNNLWLQERAEFDLLRQLLMIIDSFDSKSANWVKLALNFSQKVAIFLAECPFLGKVNHESPQKAIARLGLIAFAQYWLQRILVEKLNVAAPTSL
ncbi:MAG: hypothetical protein QNJ72_07145 [Pleurocapsa sp. MO_226.B13]|nr:hypothetical protein [Pleurocapsa sp. MO_226.B13]